MAFDITKLGEPQKSGFDISKLPSLPGHQAGAVSRQSVAPGFAGAQGKAMLVDKPGDESLFKSGMERAGAAAGSFTAPAKGAFDVLGGAVTGDTGRMKEGAMEVAKTPLSFGKSMFQAKEAGLQLLGGVGEGIMEGIRTIPGVANAEEAVGEFLVGAGKGVATELEKLSELVVGQENTNEAKKALGQGFINAIQAYEKLPDNIKQDFRAGLAVGEVAGMVTGAGEMGVALERAAGRPVAKALSQFASKQAEKKLADLDNIITVGMEKGTRPTIRGKKTPQKLEAYNQKANEAVKTIIEQKGGLKLTDEMGEAVPLPENLKQFNEAIEQTKKNVYNEYSQLAKEAGDQGVKINASEIADDLQKIVDKRITKKDVKKFAEGEIERFREFKDLSPEEADELIKDLNQSLTPFYTSGTGKIKAQVEASIASKLRQLTDDAIEDTIGKATKGQKGRYQELKNKYGSLKAIEDDVAKRSLVDARKNVAGLADFTDIFTGGEIASGIMSLNPALIAKGAAGMGLKNMIKYMNNPNRIIKSMFKKADDTLSEGGAAARKAAEIGKAQPTMGLSTQAVDDLGNPLSLEETFKTPPIEISSKIDNIIDGIEGDRFTYENLDSLSKRVYKMKADKMKPEKIKKELLNIKNGIEGDNFTMENIDSLIDELDDIILGKNKAGAAKSADLATEAKKYKSADEFIEKQPKVFHGTDQKFEKFDISKRGEGADLEGGFGDYGDGFYFTRNQDEAAEYAKGIAKQSGKSPEVMEVSLDIKKPFDMDKMGEAQSEIMFKRADRDSTLKKYGITEEDYSMFEDISGDLEDNWGDWGIGNTLKEKGYDSLYAPNGEIVVFDAKNIKTKSQLKEIWEKANKGGVKSADLATEAKKFKSADEFIEKQPKVFHGSEQNFDDFDFEMTGQASGETPVHGLKGTWFVDNKDVAKGYGKNIKESVLDTSDFHVIDADGKTLNDFRDEMWEAKKFVSEEGKGGLIINNLVDNADFSKGDVGNHIFVVDKNTIKTKDQLKKIFEEANQ